MTGYERTCAAIDFTGPDRIPMIADMLEPNFDGDVVAVYAKPIKSPEIAENVDQWGCVWEHTDIDNMGMVKDILVKQVEDLSDITIPDPTDARRYDRLAIVLERARRENKYVVYNGVKNDDTAIFERMHRLHGFAETLVDLATNVKFMEKLADMVLSYQIRQIEYVSRVFGSLIHGYRMADDWGTQTGLMISPKMWSGFFALRYKVLFDKIHKAGWHVWMHSCGRINDILMPWKEVGLNVINIQAPHMVGIAEAAFLLRDTICVETWCDIQKTLTTGDKVKIETEVCEIIDNWSTKRGGLIFRLINSTQAAQAGISEPATKIMAQAFYKLIA
jgi:hypothetical protein